MVILESDDGSLYHDNERGIWCQTFIDKDNEEIVVKNLDGNEYERYSFETWGERGSSNMELYRRYSSVSRRVVENPEKFLEEELFNTKRPDPRQVDVKYASLVTGKDVSFYWEEFNHATDTYSDDLDEPVNPN